MLTQNEVESYQMIYKKIYGVEIPKSEAYEQGLKLITLLEAILK